MQYSFKLYVVESALTSIRAIESIVKACEANLPGQYELKIIDVVKEPHLAEEGKVVATPTLVKELPPPKCTIVGDLSDAKNTLATLGFFSRRLKV